MPIRVLPPLVVNQIAAGEVIERPASLVKELVENAIDAGATRVRVDVEQGGRDLVQVLDDGHGIPPEEMPLALAPHATSKIERADDLDTIATMGFRGEALASIASVSRLRLRSRTADRDEAGLMVAEGATIEGPRPESGPVGTLVTVRNLFFNTPARRKFLKSARTETARVTEVVESLALANPVLGLELFTDGRAKLALPPRQAPRARVLAVLGAELDEALLEVEGTEQDAAAGIAMWGVIGLPSIARATSRHTRVFLNGRPIVDRAITHAMKEAYRGLIEPSRHPTAALFLEVDPARVDVNVHPAKAEVRFRDQASVHRAVLHGIRTALRGADLTPDVAVGARPSFGTGLASSLAPPPAASSSGGWSGSPSGGPAGGPGGLGGFDYAEVRRALESGAPGTGGDGPAAPAPPPPIEPGPLVEVRHTTGALQVHASYIVTEDPDGLVIIDQHALHERVMFERLKERVERGALEGQRLLTPAVVSADRAQMEALETLRPMLERLGIEAEPIGRDTVAVHAFTSLLFERGVDPVDFMGDVLTRAVEDGLTTETEAALHEVLDMMACKAAIKAGDALEPKEIESLLKERERVERASNCPHGRPTTLRLSLRELEKQFGRR